MVIILEGGGIVYREIVLYMVPVKEERESMAQSSSNNGYRPLNARTLVTAI
jgi:hypothetical protein